MMTLSCTTILAKMLRNFLPKLNSEMLLKLVFFGIFFFSGGQTQRICLDCACFGFLLKHQKENFFQTF
jgi:hypothetical protein